MVGTAEYMAPEIVVRQGANRRQDVTVDYWSLGVMIYEMATPARLVRYWGKDCSIPHAWFFALETACANAGDLASMVTIYPQRRKISEEGGWVPELPESLPPLHILPEPTPTRLLRRLNPPPTSAPRRFEKSRSTANNDMATSQHARPAHVMPYGNPAAYPSRHRTSLRSSARLHEKYEKEWAEKVKGQTGQTSSGPMDIDELQADVDEL